jgi:hypothetical protein
MYGTQTEETKNLLVLQVDLVRFGAAQTIPKAFHVESMYL